MSQSQQMNASAILTEIIDHFITAKESPGDFWAHDDAFQSYCLDHKARDGTVFWLDLEHDGTIRLVWKPARAEMRSMNFVAEQPGTDAAEVTELKAALEILRAANHALRETLAAVRGGVMVEALRPFAAAWYAYGDKPYDGTRLADNKGGAYLEACLLTFGDLRRAFEALSHVPAATDAAATREADTIIAALTVGVA